MTSSALLIGVVGPCAAGKSTLIEGLQRAGLEARHIAQEHSFVPDMWRRITDPDVLIYLDVSFPVSQARRPMAWNRAEFAEQEVRLSHARAHADLYIETDDLSPEQVLERVLAFLHWEGPTG